MAADGAGPPGGVGGARLGIPTTHERVEGLIALDSFADIEMVFDATSAKAHVANAARLAAYGKKLIDLTPARDRARTWCRR